MFCCTQMYKYYSARTEKETENKYNGAVVITSKDM